MKEKTSITLSADVLARLDRIAGSKYSRSGVIEWILRRYFSERARRRTEARDIERIDKAAAELNAEASDVLDYQLGEE